MKKAGRLTAFVLTLALLLGMTGCGKFLDSVNSLEIDGNGNVKAFSISEFDKEYYSGTELRKQILDSVSEYPASRRSGVYAYSTKAISLEIEASKPSAL